MPEPIADTRLVAIATLGERLAPLRLCDATALAAVRGSLERYGQLAMHAIRIDIDGPSYRQHVAAERAGQRPAASPPSV